MPCLGRMKFSLGLWQRFENDVFLLNKLFLVKFVFQLWLHLITICTIIPIHKRARQNFLIWKPEWSKNFYKYGQVFLLWASVPHTFCHLCLFPQFGSKRAEILHLDSSYRCPSMAPSFAATIFQTTLHKNKKMIISNLQDKNSKIW